MSLITISSSSKRWVSLTPLIDVVFILIMFFMLTTQFERTQVLAVTVAGASSSSSESLINGEKVRVLVLSDVSWEVNSRQYFLDDEVALKALAEFRYVELVASDDINLQDVVDLVDEFAKAGINELLWLPAKKPGEL